LKNTLCSRLLFSLIILSLLSFVAGCGRESKEENFSIGFTVSKLNLSVNEELVMEAMLSNRTKRNYDISHAAKIFYFHVADESGNEVNEFAMPTINLFSKLKGETTIPEQYRYIFEKPGKYKVWAIAEFSVGEETTRYHLKTEVMSIEVK